MSQRDDARNRVPQFVIVLADLVLAGWVFHAIVGVSIG